jgi:hypothetical protein
MTWESQGIRVRISRKRGVSPQFSTAPVDIRRVGPCRYAARKVVSHIVPSPYEHGFENKERTSLDREVNR